MSPYANRSYKVRIETHSDSAVEALVGLEQVDYLFRVARNPNNHDLGVYVMGDVSVDLKNMSGIDITRPVNW